MSKKVANKSKQTRLPISKILLYKEFSELGLQYFTFSISLLMLVLVIINSMVTTQIFPYDIPNEIIPLILGINMGHGLWVTFTYKKYAQIATTQTLANLTNNTNKKDSEMELQSVTTESKILTRLSGPFNTFILFAANLAVIATLIYCISQDSIPDAIYKNILLAATIGYLAITTTYYVLYAFKNNQNNRETIEANLEPFLKKS